MFRRYTRNKIAEGFFLIILFWIFLPINPQISFIGLGIVLVYFLIKFVLEQDVKKINVKGEDDDDW